MTEQDLSVRIGELGELVDRIGEVAFSRLDGLDAAVSHLRRQVSRGSADAGGTATPNPRSWAATATEPQWLALYDWVDWAVDTYQITTRALPGCWPAHPGAVEELAGLHAGWVQARLAVTQGPSDQMAYWHDRCLQPFLEKLKGPVYGLNECSQAHRPPKSDPARTDRQARVGRTAAGDPS